MTPRTPYKIGELLLHLTDRDLRILEDLEQFRLLDTRLIQRLEFPVSTRPGGQPGFATQATATRLTLRVLHRLEEHGLIARVGRRVGGSGRGSGQTVWQLAAAGERLLRARRGQGGRRHPRPRTHRLPQRHRKHRRTEDQHRQGRSRTRTVREARLRAVRHQGQDLPRHRG
ncbi:replication-relaxation family protein [Agromyces archimandritae]|uniref:Replication-relaxation family protein n=1 Tax=Agromyces archimandritae TaxID=2781962 RepID=A0A975INL9_9MICO|nr:replication-relaxation family protein [Agromyces archimandritae]QTX04700.1 replication-relaxation family protein [Agromyces archimandritae]